MSFLETIRQETEPLARVLAELLGTVELEVREVNGGRNGKVYFVSSTARERAFAVKKQNLGLEGRSRLRKEYDALVALERLGVGAVPRPVMLSEEFGFLIETWIPGAAIDSATAKSDDVAALVRFLHGLHSVRLHPIAESVALASDAAFPVDAIDVQIQARLTRIRLEENISDELRSHLKAIEFASTLTERACAWEIRKDSLTLSPSDFGFHNTLKKSDGTLVFLDFEHFGWDDPAKLVGDFLLHPNSQLPISLREEFLQNSCVFFGNEDFHLRLSALFPKLALKWSLILLNEFTVAGLARRQFSRKLEPHALEELRQNQLTKSRLYLRMAQECAGSSSPWTAASAVLSTAL